MTDKLHSLIYFLRHCLLAKRGGHGVHSPFVYQLCEEVFYNKHHFYEFEKLAKIRQGLLEDKREIEVEDYGAGSRVFKSKKRPVSAIARKGISSQKKSELLFRMIHYLRPATVVELGTSIGLNTIYLSKAAEKSKVYTLEGSESLSRFALELATQSKIQNCDFVSGRFEEQLEQILNRVERPLFAFIDGNHTYKATIEYFQSFASNEPEDLVMVFDDIYWSPAMTKAWEQIKIQPQVTLSIDTFDFGIIFLRKEMKEKVHLRLSV